MIRCRCAGTHHALEHPAQKLPAVCLPIRPDLPVDLLRIRIKTVQYDYFGTSRNVNEGFFVARSLRRAQGHYSSILGKTDRFGACAGVQGIIAAFDTASDAGSPGGVPCLSCYTRQPCCWPFRFRAPLALCLGEGLLLFRIIRPNELPSTPIL